jgi:hypothetical protein
MNTPLEFDEKKFWIALFSIMAQRGAANAKRNHRVFCAIHFFVWRAYNSKRISNSGESQSIKIFL